MAGIVPLSNSSGDILDSVSSADGCAAVFLNNQGHVISLSLEGLAVTIASVQIFILWKEIENSGMLRNFFNTTRLEIS